MTVYQLDRKYFINAMETLHKMIRPTDELIVVCRTLKDETTLQHILSTYDFAYKVARKDSGGGRVERFNLAVKLAKKEWFIVHDSDDLLSFAAIPAVEISIGRYPETQVFSSGHTIINEKGHAISKNWAQPSLFTLTGMPGNFRQMHLWGMRRQFWIDNPVFQQCKYPCEDYYIFAHLMKMGIDVLPIPASLYYYRQHQEQLTRRNWLAVKMMCEDLDASLRAIGKKRGVGQKAADLLQLNRLTHRYVTLEKMMP